MPCVCLHMLDWFHVSACHAAHARSHFNRLLLSWRHVRFPSGAELAPNVHAVQEMPSGAQLLQISSELGLALGPSIQAGELLEQLLRSIWVEEQQPLPAQRC